MKKMNVVLVGCGYVSVWTYKLIAQHAGKQLRNGEIEITMVSDADYHAFHGFTGEFLNGYLPLEVRETPFPEILPHARLLKGRVTAVNQTENYIEYKPQTSWNTQKLSYDHLVIGTGSVDNLDSIPGMKVNGLSVKKPGGILECRQRILESLEKASLAKTRFEREKYLTFCVIGGGFAAVEICGNLAELLHILQDQFPVLQRYEFKIHLIYSGKEILPQVEKKFNLCRKYAQKILSDLNIRLTPCTEVVSIREDYVEQDNGERIPTIVPICTVGQKAVHLDTTIPFIFFQDRICVDKQLRANKFDNIWVGGDAAFVLRPHRNTSCRHDALWAIKHGTRIGKNLARLAKGKKTGNFKYPGLGQTASFYKHKAILELYGLQFTGLLAWLNRIGFFLYFMPSRKFAYRTLLHILQNNRKKRLQYLMQGKVQSKKVLAG